MNDNRRTGDRRVIVLGASPERWRFSNKAVRCYLELGYTVFPVHPTAREVEGLPVFASIPLVPENASLLLMYVRPGIGLACVEEAPGRGVESVILNPGTSSPALVERIAKLGMKPIEECAIVRVGRSPAEFPG